MKRKYYRLGGFTLIELLVVVAIIAVLASLIIINLNSKRKISSINSLQKTAQQIVTSAQLYLDDNPSANSVSIDYLIPDYMTALQKNQEIIGGVVSLVGGSSSFELMDNGGAADGCVARVTEGQVPTTEEISETCE